MKSIEKVWYESFPYLFAAIGLVAVIEANKIAGAFGSSLLLTSVLIIRDRCVYRFKIRGRNHPLRLAGAIAR